MGMSPDQALHFRNHRELFFDSATKPKKCNCSVCGCVPCTCLLILDVTTLFNALRVQQTKSAEQELHEELETLGHTPEFV